MLTWENNGISPMITSMKSTHESVPFNHSVVIVCATGRRLKSVLRTTGRSLKSGLCTTSRRLKSGLCATAPRLQSGVPSLFEPWRRKWPLLSNHLLTSRLTFAQEDNGCPLGGRTSLRRPSRAGHRPLKVETRT